MMFQTYKLIDRPGPNSKFGKELVESVLSWIKWEKESGIQNKKRNIPSFGKSS